MLEIIQSDFSARPEKFFSEDDPFYDANPGGWRISMRSTAWKPPTDIYETEDTFGVRVEIAGMREEDFIVQLEGRYLSIHGTRSESTGRKAYHQMEIRFGEFAIELELPAPVISTEVQASYNEGFLMVQLPKAKPRQIIIKE
jgi:HSP20 family protein